MLKDPKENRPVFDFQMPGLRLIESYFRGEKVVTKSYLHNSYRKNLFRKILLGILRNYGTYQKKFWYVPKKIMVGIKKNSGTYQKK
jgi:hypothetical protein